MRNLRWIRILAPCCLLALIMLIPIICSATGQIGVVLMHGKTGNPDFMTNAIGRSLQQAGFLVDTPEMPWSKIRYIDKTYEEALDEIDQAIERLRGKGANKIVVAGHSMGGDATLAYAAYHGKIDGVILLAPGHTPDSQGFKRYQTDVAKAKAMMDAGNGDKVSTFNDGNMGVGYLRNMKAAIYFSYFNPEGIGAMSKAAGMINPNIPVIYIVGSQDPLTANLGKSYAFDKLPNSKLARYMTVTADHLGTPFAATSVIIEWLSELAKQ